MSLLSNCCQAPMTELSEAFGTCARCHEHCVFEDDEAEDYGEREFTPAQQAIIDRLAEEAKQEGREG